MNGRKTDCSLRYQLSDLPAASEKESTLHRLQDKDNQKKSDLYPEKLSKGMQGKI